MQRKAIRHENAENIIEYIPEQLSEIDSTKIRKMIKNNQEEAEKYSAVSSNCGYVTEIRIGNYKMRGNAFRTSVLGLSEIKSHCFTVEYIPA